MDGPLAGNDGDRGAIGVSHVMVLSKRNRPPCFPKRLEPGAPRESWLRELGTHTAQRLAPVSRRESQSNPSVPSNEAKADTTASLRAGSAGDTTHSDKS